MIAETESRSLISKPPDAEVLPGIEEALETFGKPHVVCFLGAENPDWAETLEDAGHAVAAILKGETYRPENFFAQAGLKEKIASLRPEGAAGSGGVLGFSQAVRSPMRAALSWRG